MKKIFILVLLLVFTMWQLPADHGSGLGLGLVVGSSFGEAGLGGGDIALSVHFPSLPIFWAFGLNINSNIIGLRVIGDYYMIEDNITSNEDIKLDWFWGLGGVGSIIIGDELGLAIGARMPIGLSMHFLKDFELWLDLAPTLGLSLAPSIHFPWWHIPAELGFRYWF